MTERPPATQLDLHTVAGADVSIDRTFSPGEIGHDAEDVRPVGDIRLAGRLQKRDEARYRLVGQLRATLELDCSRCLEPFVLPLDIPIDLTYMPHPAAPAAKAEATADAEVELSDEDLTTAFYRDHVLDLAEMVREQFHLATPMRALCRDACRGLCPQCGTNLNVETCQCQAAWEDPRLAALRTLIEKPGR